FRAVCSYPLLVPAGCKDTCRTLKGTEMGGEAGEREGDEREGKKGNERMVEEWRKYGSEDGEQRRGQSKDRRREK
ncbi:hypothetical protein KUCAC02_005405, partial [Chaenocephalus aceratus]